jgi:hypothetical protein
MNKHWVHMPCVMTQNARASIEWHCLLTLAGTLIKPQLPKQQTASKQQWWAARGAAALLSHNSLQHATPVDHEADCTGDIHSRNSRAQPNQTQTPAGNIHGLQTHGEPLKFAIWALASAHTRIEQQQHAALQATRGHKGSSKQQTCAVSLDAAQAGA